jgi:hypothetical protein
MGKLGESGKVSGVNSVVLGCGVTRLSGTASVGGRLVAHAYRIRVQKRSG